MYEWLAELVRWLHDFISEVPIYVAAPAMVLIGALDSSLLSLPEINDYLVVARCYSDPKSVFYFPLFAAAGSVIGCLVLYSIMRRGGQAVMRRRFSAENIAKVERAYARFGFLALAVPALLPPPMPFKIFVATAGAAFVYLPLTIYYSPNHVRVAGRTRPLAARLHQRGSDLRRRAGDGSDRRARLVAPEPARD